MICFRQSAVDCVGALSVHADGRQTRETFCKLRGYLQSEARDRNKTLRSLTFLLGDRGGVHSNIPGQARRKRRANLEELHLVAAGSMTRPPYLQAGRVGGFTRDLDMSEGAVENEFRLAFALGARDGFDRRKCCGPSRHSRTKGIGGRSGLIDRWRSKGGYLRGLPRRISPGNGSSCQDQKIRAEWRALGRRQVATALLAAHGTLQRNSQDLSARVADFFLDLDGRPSTHGHGQKNFSISPCGDGFRDDPLLRVYYERRTRTVGVESIRTRSPGPPMGCAGRERFRSCTGGLGTKAAPRAISFRETG